MDTRPTIKNFIIVIFPAVFAVFIIFFLVLPHARQKSQPVPPDAVYTGLITNFAQCALAGNAIMESYPRRCRSGDVLFLEEIGNELEKHDIIRVDYPRPNAEITSPLIIKGEARGTWFFEASFPVVLVDWDGRIISQSIAQAKSDWMTEDFVPFEATLTFALDKDIYSNRGALILQKDNPSGLPEHDDALEFPVLIGAASNNDAEWQAIVEAIQNCEVVSTMQAHSLEVSAELKDGSTLRAIEPSIDDIIDVAVEVEDRCGEILMGTE